MESPIMNDRQWQKLPAMNADAFMIDLEDSVHPAHKEEARERAVRYMANPSFFGGRPLVPRCNDIRTEWGLEDLRELARVKAPLVCYPKVEDAEELREVNATLRKFGHSPDLFVMIENARALVNLTEICRTENVVGVHFGLVDFAADVGFDPYDENQHREAVYAYPRMKIAVTAAAFGLFCTTGTLIPQFRDLGVVRNFVMRWSSFGFTGFLCVYPSHIDVVNNASGPSDEAVEAARKICEVYESARALGRPAIQFKDRLVTLPDYKVAQRVVEGAKRSELNGG
jgi:citrate lyase beta subunit